MAGKRKDNKGRALRAGETQRSDGTYHYTYLDIRKKRQYVYAKTLSELREKEKELERDRLDGIDNASAKMTLNQLFMIHMGMKTDIKESTRANYLRMWKHSVESSEIGMKSIGELKKIHVKSFYSDLSNRGMKRNSIKLLHNLIFATLELAADSDFIRKNPAKDCMREIKEDSVEKKPLSEEEIDRLLDFCKDSVYSVHIPFLIIAIGTCMRIGELSGLTWEDVDLKKRTIRVNHQLIYKNYGDGCKFHITKPKTEAGIRTIPMTQAVHDAFVEIRKKNMVLGRRCITEVDGYGNFVFLVGSGLPMAVNSVNAFLLNIEKAYNKKYPDNKIPHLSAHILRHTGCTRYASAGMDLKALQDLMGHADAQVTLNVYNHKNNERTEKEVQRIEEAMNL